jgi:hypothetical protein
MVIGSRFVRGALVQGVPRLRRITALGAAALFKLIHPVRGVRDYTCGYRTYRVSALKRASNWYGAKLIEESEFSCMPELLLKLNALGSRITEVPFQLRYDRKPTASKMRVGRNMKGLVKLLVHLRLRGLKPSQAENRFFKQLKYLSVNLPTIAASTLKRNSKRSLASCSHISRTAAVPRRVIGRWRTLWRALRTQNDNRNRT